ncbi:MAG: competence/damage-inducible protein A [candidate division NC10 bacterium]|nr:competence/damage-inducible protein A [candidate division NC10 bacterium]MBI2457672.1 competence/damage-inducible protein A [candidate division NC10 bacterium]MBI2560946.1 competence/damage-inducible protein A [candidate division NC10 bacterium]MBI3085522.1 competence/damage-inducible protein A [candidate division NC10 bacterium]
MTMIRAVIVAVGREILRGRIQDTNSWTLARRLTGLGYEVMRTVACDDDRPTIAREIRRAIEDGASLILTTGGLGPTDDDLTLQALAEATGRPLVLDQEARRMVDSRYAALHRAGAVEAAGMTRAREKMAWIPGGARPLPNPVGTAPGVWLEEGGTTVVALPGVPGEMAAILEGSVLPALASRQPGAVYVERRITTEARDESEVAPVLRRIARDVPEVFLKSHPTRFGADVRLQVFASTWAGDRTVAEERVARALALLREALGEAPPGR